jgi:ubiquitin
MTSFPSEKIENYTQDDAQEDTCCKGKIEGKILPLYNDIPGELAQKGDAVLKEEQHGSNSGDYDAGYYQKLSQLNHKILCSCRPIYNYS